MTQEEKARRFRDLHYGPAILVLPNARDAAAAKASRIDPIEALRYE